MISKKKLVQPTLFGNIASKIPYYKTPTIPYHHFINSRWKKWTNENKHEFIKAADVEWKDWGKAASTFNRNSATEENINVPNSVKKSLVTIMKEKPQPSFDVKLSESTESKTLRKDAYALILEVRIITCTLHNYISTYAFGFKKECNIFLMHPRVIQIKYKSYHCILQ